MKTLNHHKNIIKQLLLLLSLPVLLINTARAQSWAGQEQTTVIKIAGVTTESQISALTTSQKQVTTQYTDGLGRVIQSIAVQASPAGNDLVQTSAYNTLGQQTTGYLPYAASNAGGGFRTTAGTDLTSFYASGQGGKVAIDSYPYSQQVFENSPLQRLLKAGSVGNGFQPTQHFKAWVYRPNTTADAVIIWNADGTTSANFALSTLAVSQAADEQGVTIQLFKNLDGKLILQRKLINETIAGVTESTSDTYYIYNDDGTIAYVVPPKAVSAMRAASNWNVNQTGVSSLVYKFSYDYRGRPVQKTVPGGSALYMVYDTLSRPVLIQDGNMRNNNTWNYIKYDASGRAISQGIYTDATHTTLASMQAYVKSINYTVNYYEIRTGTVTNNGYYTNVSFPTTSIQPLAYSYYDDYDLNRDGSPDYAYQAQGLSAEATPTAFTRGMVTIVSKTTVGAGLSTGVWLNTIMFYDQKGRPIQTLSNNHTNSAATLTDTKTIVPDFIGKTTVDKTVKSMYGTAATVLSTYSYDAAGRLAAIDQSYNGAAALRIAAYTYNELGQMVYKRLHSKDGGSTFMQSVDYRYNIQGKLLTVNNSTLTANSNNNTAGTGALFGMEFLYDKVDAAPNSLNNTPYYNGLLSGVKWMVNTGTLSERSYKFSYDDQNRLTTASYGDRPSGNGVWGNLTAYDEKGISYDQNGNIVSLQRNYLNGATVQPIDNLQYIYNGNQLNTVTDGSGGSYASLGFKNMTGSTATYVYDPNGNLTTDPYKGLSLNYNVLNRTDKITVTTAANRYINYTYAATGELIRKQQYDNNVLKATTDYVDGFVGLGGVLSYFPMPEGRVRNTGTALKPEYIITDQQGNARISFEESATPGVAAIRQENSYYPFGLIMPGSKVATPTTDNKQLYNGGSEWQNDYQDLPDYYQTYYRNYDAALGRFVGVDPMAEATASMSTYAYAGNNPLSMNDPMGDIGRGVDFNGYKPWVPQDPGNSSSFASMVANDPNNTYGPDLLQQAKNGDPYALALYLELYGKRVGEATSGKSYYFDTAGKLSATLENGSGTNTFEQDHYIAATSSIKNYDILSNFEGLKLLALNDLSSQATAANQGGMEGISTSLFLTSTTFSLLNENATRNINAIQETNSW